MKKRLRLSWPVMVVSWLQTSNLFADEEAIETEVAPADTEGFAELVTYSLMKKRLRRWGSRYSGHLWDGASNLVVLNPGKLLAT